MSLLCLLEDVDVIQKCDITEEEILIAFDLPERCTFGEPALSVSTKDSIEGPIMVPRSCIPNLHNHLQCDETYWSCINGIPYSKPPDIHCDIKLFENQQVFLEQMEQMFHITSEELNVSVSLLELQCGYGKTFISVYAMANGVLELPCIVITPTAEIQNQWINIISSLTSLKVGKLNGSICKLAHCEFPDVIVSSSRLFQTMKDTTIGLSIAKTFKSAVYDELHMLMGPQIRKIFSHLYVKQHLGLTATPEINTLSRAYIRRLFPYGIVPQDDRMSQFTLDIRLITLSGDDTFKHSKYRSTKAIKNTSHKADIIRQMTVALNDPRRIYCIDYIVPQIISKPTLIFVSQKADANRIAVRLLRCGVKNIGVLSGDVSSVTRSQNVEHANTIVATYQAASTGFSESRFHNIVLWAPITNPGQLKQTIGRILRVPDGITRTIFDIADQWGRTELRQTIAARKYYYKLDSDNVSIRKERLIYKNNKWIKQ